MDSFSNPLYQEVVLHFIIEELPTPRDCGLFKILYGSTEIALDTVALDEPGVVVANWLIGFYAATIRKYPYEQMSMEILRLRLSQKLKLVWFELI